MKFRLSVNTRGSYVGLSGVLLSFGLLERVLLRETALKISPRLFRYFPGRDFFFIPFLQTLLIKVIERVAAIFVFCLELATFFAFWEMSLGSNKEFFLNHKGDLFLNWQHFLPLKSEFEESYTNTEKLGFLLLDEKKESIYSAPTTAPSLIKAPTNR